MARDLGPEVSAFTLATVEPRQHRPAPAPRLDRSARFDADGRPTRPVDDLLTARYMVQRGFPDEDVRHLLGYLPEGMHAESDGPGR
ncbi:hypothetical protein MOTC310_08000 [Methylobacterium oryzae]|uniref:Uncharacterized protein n=1 Tax=Methylobacterium oryzae TaxID=334852 RepID=A0ABU7TL25_9HYPH